MKHSHAYGTYVLTRRIARRIQLEWDRVEQPARLELFLARPRREGPAPTEVGPVAPTRRTERRPFAA